MAMQPGDKLGPYEVVSAIGAGGMGEVYKARDTRLDRTVAVKVLPEHIAQREDSRARFEREARAVASLNHPNICSLFDIGPGYMVMELIEGETLAARIEKGALPLDQALKLATQIADALDRAHRAGVTHRDIKPQNIMLTRDGVKVLDFGLAKSQSQSGPTEATLTKVLTTEGTVMGTPQYMAPEQFEGKEADARSDIWAFGAVLYEMVTGRKAFEGTSYSSLVGAILATDPAPLSVQPFTPRWLERLVRRCLAKDPEDRWQSMRDVVLELRTPMVESAGPAKPSRWPWAIAFGALLLGPLIGWVVSRPPQGPVSEQVRRFQLSPPEGGQFNVRGGVAISPDGRTLAFAATAKGKDGIWIRSIDSTAARELPGTEGAAGLFWSPDGRSIAYAAADKLWRVEVAGGAPVAICDAPIFFGGDWAADGTIVFSASLQGLRRVRAAGGIPEVLTTPDTSRGETSHRWPVLLPGGRLLFRVFANPEQTGIYVAPLANLKDRVRLIAAGDSNALYAAGYLFWLRGTTLVGQRFDTGRLELTGEPKPIADPVTPVSRGATLAAVSADGLLIHGSAAAEHFAWVDRTGKNPIAFGNPGIYPTFRLSPDGRHLAVSRREGLWMVDLERNDWSRFTFLPGGASYPVWSPDSKQVLFRAGNPWNLYRKQAGGAGIEQRITESVDTQWAEDWSGDGRQLLYTELVPDTQRDLWVLPVTPDGSVDPGGKARPYIRTRFNEQDGRFSPGASPRWVAYQSDESGRNEIYVQGFPEPSGKWQISSGGGTYPEWAPDGRELYYVAPGRKLMAAGIQLRADSVVPSTPRELFALPSGGERTGYGLAPDGKRFLVQVPVDSAKPLEVITNWPALLKQGEPPK